jgi:hypothetical protein
MAAPEYVGRGKEDGVIMGRSSGNGSKIGFFGTTPVVKQTGAAVATDTTTSIVLTTAMRLALVNYGLMTDV